MIRASSLLWLAVLTAAAAGKSTAQDVTVFYQHLPGAPADDLVVFYQLATDTEDQRRRGLPKRLRVPEGGRACFVVENGNPLLYTYSASGTAIKTEQPEIVPEIIEVVKGMLGGAAISAGAAADPHVTYAESVSELYASSISLQETLAASDEEADVSTTLTQARAKLTTAQQKNAAADQAFKPLEADLTDDLLARMLRAGQTDVWGRVQKMKAQIDSAGVRLARPMCVPVADELKRVVFAAKYNGQGTARRPVGDSLVAVEVEPISNRAIEVGTGVIFSLSPSDQRSFSVANGVIRGEDDRSPAVRPAAFLLARAWSLDWLWGAVGVSADKSGVSDLFVGPVARFGGQVIGTRLTLGAGLSLARFPVALNQGSEGEPLPENVSNIDDIVTRKLRSTLGVTLTLSGL
jgi:hypothetical protein